MDTYIHAYKVMTKCLPEATQAINGNWGCLKSRVIHIEVMQEVSIVIVEMQGTYPYITNQWDEFICS
jgi:hypothetical protein